MSGRRRADLDDERLGAVLGAIGAELDLTPTRPRAVPTSALAGAIAVLSVVLATLAIGPARRTVADWFGIGHTSFDVDPDLDLAPEPSVARPVALVDGPEISPVDAERHLGRPLPDLAGTAIGVPDSWHDAGDDAVDAVWVDRSWSLRLWATDADADVMVMKAVHDIDQIEWVDNLGDGGALIRGAHRRNDADGVRTAGTTVVWQGERLIARLEAPPGAGAENGDELLATAYAVNEELDG